MELLVIEKSTQEVFRASVRAQLGMRIIVFCSAQRWNWTITYWQIICLLPTPRSLILSDFLQGFITVTLRRENANQPWGFRLQGGKDRGLPLQLLKVCCEYLTTRQKVQKNHETRQHWKRQLIPGVKFLYCQCTTFYFSIIRQHILKIVHQKIRHRHVRPDMQE